LSKPKTTTTTTKLLIPNKLGYPSLKLKKKNSRLVRVRPEQPSETQITKEPPIANQQGTSNRTIESTYQQSKQTSLLVIKLTGVGHG
jgi:hypothetical protein